MERTAQYSPDVKPLWIPVSSLLTRRDFPLLPQASMKHKEEVIFDVTIERTQKTLDEATNLNSTSAAKLDMWDHAEDFIAQTAQEVVSAHDFYNQNATAFKSSSDAMVTDLSKKNMGDFLGEAKKVMDALDSLQQIHPFVGVAILAFKAVVNLELTRRENDRRVGLMIAQASDMMVMLLQLKDTKDPAIVGPHGEIRGRLQRVTDGIKKDIEDCGNAIDKYYKSKFVVKFFRSSHWASEFVKICSSFSQRTQDLQLALNIRTTLRVDIAIDKLEKLIQRPSEREAKFEKEVQRRGGREKCLESEDALVELLKFAEQREARPQNKARPDPASKDANKPTSKTTSASGSVVEQYRLDASLLHELRAPLRSLLDENRALFMFKLDTQTSDIKDAIKDSEARIMWAFNSRFRRVKDPHLRYIWKEMKWTTSVKTLYFIAELHDYYVNRFSRLRHDAPPAQETSEASSLILRVPSPTPTVSVASDSEGEDRDLQAVDSAYRELPTVDLADKWCLKYLSVFYVPSLSEGFDGDANGLVSIREVNSFTSTTPSGWSLPQTLAYWAAGWRVDSQYYHARIEQVLNSMVYVHADALPENRRCIATYLNSYVIDGIKRLVRSIADLGSEDSDLDLTQLAAQRRTAQEEILADKLNIVKYEIDSRDTIKLFGSGRIENFLLPLLYLIIRRHLQIMRLASTVILVERELESATQTIENILGGVTLRVEQLAESFRQLGNDPKVRFTWYAHGLYNFWYSPELTTDDTEYWETHNYGLDETEFDIDATALKLGPFSLAEKDEALETPVKLTATSPGQQPEDTKDEYIRLWCMNELHNARNFYPYEITPYLSSEEKQRFNSLCDELPPSDVQRWNSLAELHVRRRLFECSCDACHCLVTDVLHRCIDCDSNQYDLCAECESLPVSEHKYPSDHKSTHNMLVFRMPLPHGRYKRVQWYARNYLSTCMPNAPPPEGPSTAQEDECRIQSNGTELPPSTEATQTDVACAPLDSPADDEELSGNSGAASGGIVEVETSVADGDAYTCAECGVKMKGIFYVCLTCGEIQTAIALCGDCAFRDVFNVVTAHHPHKHWLVKIKDKVQDAGGASDEPPDDSDETSSLSLRVDKLAAMVESRFAEQDRRLDALITQVDLLVHSLAGSTGKAQLPLESVSV
ncbi:uncharacterized protein EDB91DRAFT_1250037 [Suillus paluster]|uniref:uncharacterized protein n=1 Tax=Suillus paluster TaxID=48578 RepID=UPI001B861A34|nr:uncharacterized protein EDB91DRAFT_1250037 [Suillus paluster]KAG1736414.1 hypothetical protein EDB91DRAFT_1250037 [Suillus paluster]